MADETIGIVSAFVNVCASASTADQAFNDGTKATLSAGLTAPTDAYALIDFDVNVTVGTPTENGTIDIYMRPAANGSAPVPAGAYRQQYIGSVGLDNATGHYYLFGVSNVDWGTANYYGFNNSGTTLTFEINARTRTWGPAP